MKLRIQGNSIRVRLTQGEVHRLGCGGSVEQTTAFSPLAKFCSRVESSPRAQKPSATFENQCLTVSLPSVEARQWAESDQVGIEAEQPIGNGTPLRLLIEKDFECVHPHGEEIGNAFPRPKEAANRS
jgi:uncharacterized protein DUF7009